MLRATGYNKSAVSAQTSPHPRYHFLGYGGENVTGDSKFFDRSGMGNHAVRGANLSEANMLANAGYVSTIESTGGTTDTALRIPNLNFDYAGGEKLIVYWLGKITPEANTFEWMGDGYGSSNHGVNVRATPAGKVNVNLFGATAAYSSNSTATAFDGNLHSVAFTIDGATNQYTIWVDEVLDKNAGYGGGSVYDTKNSATFNVGSVVGAPGSATADYGGIVQTRALHILRLAANEPIPSIANLQKMFIQLRVDPSKPVLGGAALEAVDYAAPLPATFSPVFEVDATKPDSWDGVSGLFKNRISVPAYGGAQEDYHWKRGSTAGADTSDPTFTGTVGDREAYFALDGGDYFSTTQASVAEQPDILKGLHRTDLGIKHTFIFVGSMPSTGAANVSQAWFGNCLFSTDSHGFALFSGVYFSQRDKLVIARRDGVATSYTGLNTAATADGTDKVIITTYDAATGNWTIWVNGTKTTGTLAAFTSTVNGDGRVVLGAAGPSNAVLLNGSKIYAAAMLNKIVTDAEAAQLLTIFRSRHGRSY